MMVLGGQPSEANFPRLDCAPGLKSLDILKTFSSDYIKCLWKTSPDSDIPADCHKCGCGRRSGLLVFYRGVHRKGKSGKFPWNIGKPRVFSYFLKWSTWMMLIYSFFRWVMMSRYQLWRRSGPTVVASNTSVILPSRFPKSKMSLLTHGFPTVSDLYPWKTE